MLIKKLHYVDYMIMNPNNLIMIENAKNQILELEKGGIQLVNQRIKEWKEKGEGVAPIVDIDVLKLEIRYLSLEHDYTPLGSLLGDVWNTLLMRSFEAKLAEYELNFQK